jgi:NAD dependent epimerase/dehydratase family enzyme
LAGARASAGAALAGPVNLTAPAPVTNAEFTRALGRAVHRPAVFWVPGPVLEAGLGEASGELTGGCRVRPGRLLGAGFTFRYPGIDAALAAALRG